MTAVIPWDSIVMADDMVLKLSLIFLDLFLIKYLRFLKKIEI